MKHTLILMLAVLLLSCNTHKTKEIELIAFFSGIDFDVKNDSLITIVKCKLYAQIEDDGSCILNIKEYQKRNRFITFKIGKEILDSVYTLVYNSNSDTAVCKKADPNNWYHGPLIRIAGKNKNGKRVQLVFQHSDRSNINCLRLYNLLDSVGKTNKVIKDIDTTKILQAKEILTKQIYTEIHAYRKKFVKINHSIKFVPPTFKKPL